MAGLRVGQRSEENLGDSRRVMWSSWIQEGDRRAMVLCESKWVNDPLTKSKRVNDHGYPKSKFFAFLSKKHSCRQSMQAGCHPCVWWYPVVLTDKQWGQRKGPAPVLRLLGQFYVSQ